MKRILAVIMSLVMVAAVFTSCGKQIEETPGVTEGQDNGPVVSGDAGTAPEIPPENGDGVTEPVPEDDPNMPVNPNPSTGETWNGYDISFVKENGIQYIWDRLDNEKKENLASALTSIRELSMFVPYKYPIPGGNGAKDTENYEFMQLILNCAMDYPYVNNQVIEHDNDDDGMVDAITIMVNFDVVQTEEDAWNMTKRLNEKLDEIVAGMPDGSEYEQLRYLHDYLVFNCTYSDSIPTFYTAYGALIDGQATCQGYADAMHLLLARAGFETCFCVGRGNNIEVTHKWNYVKLSDGQWYILDPTWADPAEKDDLSYISYDYFLISDEELMKDHKVKFDSSFYEVPVATSMEHCYHKTEGYFCSTYDEAKEIFRKQLKLCAENGTHYLYLKMDNAEQYDEVRDRMLRANRADGSHGEIMDLITEVVNETGVNFNPKSWSVYNGYEDGKGPMSFIVTIKYTE